MADQTPVDELEGRELDAAVAREVMGWREVSPLYTGYCPDWDGEIERWRSPISPRLNCHEVPHYSDDIAAAWNVFLLGARKGWWNAIIPNPHFNETYVVFTGSMGDNTKYLSTADTAPEAICRAALKAVRSQD